MLKALKGKTLLALLVCSLLVFMTACSNGSDKSEDGVTELVFWHAMNGSAGEALDNIVKDFNDTVGKENDIKVTTVYQGYEITSKIRLVGDGRDSENTPDIGQIVGSDIPTILSLPITVKAEDYITEKDSAITKDDFYNTMLRAFTYKDELIGVPLNTSTLMLYYNEDILKEAGYNEPPKTMDEVTEVIIATMEKDGDNVTRHGLNMQTARYQLVNFIVSQFPESFVGDHEGGRTSPMTKVTIGEDGTLKNFLTKLDDWVKTGGYKYIEDNINEEFATGLHSMAIMSSSRINTIEGLVGDSFEWNTAYIPKVNESDTSGASVGGSSLVMFKRGDEKRVDASWKFIEYASSPEVQAEFSKATGYLPSNVESENLDVLKKHYEEHPQFKMALDQMKDSHPNAQEPFDLVNWEVDGKIKDIVLQFCEGKLTVDEAVEKIVNDYNAALDEYHEANS